MSVDDNGLSVASKCLKRMILLALARHLPCAESVAGEFFDSPSLLKQLRMTDCSWFNLTDGDVHSTPPAGCSHGTHFHVFTHLIQQILSILRLRQ